VAHARAALESYDGLSPRVEAYSESYRSFSQMSELKSFSNLVFDDGHEQSLLCLSGVIPVRLGGNIYNCPLALWLPLEYPAQPPMTLILPTSNMQIKKGAAVDPNGRVTVAYLEKWERQNGVSVGCCD
jgi:hypothetical protein